MDPTEFQSLKDELESMKTEKSALETQQTTQTGELAQLQEKVGDFYIYGWHGAILHVLRRSPR